MLLFYENCVLGQISRKNRKEWLNVPVWLFSVILSSDIKVYFAFAVTVSWL